MRQHSKALFREYSSVKNLKSPVDIERRPYQRRQISGITNDKLNLSETPQQTSILQYLITVPFVFHSREVIGLLDFR